MSEQRTMLNSGLPYRIKKLEQDLLAIVSEHLPVSEEPYTVQSFTEATKKAGIAVAEVNSCMEGSHCLVVLKEGKEIGRAYIEPRPPTLEDIL